VASAAGRLTEKYGRELEVQVMACCSVVGSQNRMSSQVILFNIMSLGNTNPKIIGFRPTLAKNI
jgi:hypothetical protein